MTYSHTQTGKMHYIGYALAVVFIWAAVLQRSEAAAVATILAAAAIVILMTRCFAEMTVEDDGEFLVIRYGPVPLFSKRLAYREMVSVRKSKSKWIDGLGIHFVPWRGWTFNLWGFSCAEIHLRGKKRAIRVGSDDCEALVGFLQRRIVEQQENVIRGK